MGILGRPLRALTTAARAVMVGWPATQLLVMGYRRRWVSEDAFIDLRVVQNLLTGDGPVFNVGERVEVYTNPLWVSMLAAVRAVGAPVEVGAVALGLLLSVAGLVAAQAGAGALARRLDDGPGAPGRRVALPLGAAVLAAVPATWDYATSGLETGLVFGWLGVAFWLLERLGGADASATERGAASRACRWGSTAFVIGLGPLIRPDLAIFSAGFLVALGVALACAPGATRTRVGWGRVVLAALLTPAAYQVFRMGYFAALVPNTALAKEAGVAYWTQGWDYAADFLGTYMLWVPLVSLAVWWAIGLGRARRRRDWAAAALLLAPAVSGIAHALYVIRVGGDFMHGRLFLPSLWGALLPVATLAWRETPGHRWRSSLAKALALAIVAWIIVCAAWLRVPYAGEIGPAGIADERGFYVRYAEHPHPVAARDYAATGFATQGVGLRDRARTADGAGETRARVLLVDGEFLLAPTVHRTVRVVAFADNIGLTGYFAGPAVHLVDRWGLSDPIASRLRLATRGRPGHEKELPHAWSIARFADPSAAVESPGVVAARTALGCGALSALRRAVGEPLTPMRFVRNLALAWPLHRLRVPADPAEAMRELCGRP